VLILGIKKKQSAHAGEFYPDSQLNTVVIKRHIMFQTTSRIVSETVWSSNAFSLAGLPHGEYLLYPASLYIRLVAMSLLDSSPRRLEQEIDQDTPC